MYHKEINYLIWFYFLVLFTLSIYNHFEYCSNRQSDRLRTDWRALAKSNHLTSPHTPTVDLSRLFIMMCQVKKDYNMVRNLVKSYVIVVVYSTVICFVVHIRNKYSSVRYAWEPESRNQWTDQLENQIRHYVFVIACQAQYLNILAVIVVYDTGL